MRKFRRFFCLLILPIVIASFCSPSNVLALRAGIENKTPDLVAAGMESPSGEPSEKAAAAPKEAGRSQSDAWMRGPFVSPPDPRWEPFTVQPERAVEILEGKGLFSAPEQVRKLWPYETLLIPGFSRSSDAYISKDGRVLFLSKGDTLTIQMENPGKRNRLLIQEGTVTSAGKKWERRLEISVEKEGHRRVLFMQTHPEAELSLIRGISYWDTAEEGAELSLIVDPRVERIKPGVPWDRTVFSASPLLLEKGSFKDEDVRIVLEVLSPSKPEPKQPKAPPSIWWAGNLPLQQVISGDPRPPLISLDLHVPELSRDALMEALELVLIVELNGKQIEFPVSPGQMQFGEGLYGPHYNNYRVRIKLPEAARSFLQKTGHLRFHFQFRLKGEPGWKDTDQLPHKHHGVGEIVSQPDWMFQGGIYTINVKAWGSFKAIRDRLDDLVKLGVKVISLQGVEPTFMTVFEIDDYEKVDTALGGEDALRDLLTEGKKKRLHFIKSFVPGHSSPRNPLLQEHPELYYHPADPHWLPDAQRVTVDVKGTPQIFMAGNVFKKPDKDRLPDGTPRGEFDGFGPGTVQFALWKPEVRDWLTLYWERVLNYWSGLGFDGFYTDTGHSLWKIAPGWLEDLQRRVRMDNPDLILGFETHWGEGGGFVMRGGSFAQRFELYDEGLREVVKGKKTAAQLAQILSRIPLRILRQQMGFAENHDEDRFALHLEWSPIPPALQPAANRAFTALLVLGMGVIPHIHNGQEIGDKVRMDVSGRPWVEAEAIRKGASPEDLPHKTYDPFADNSDTANIMRDFVSDVLRIRASNPAFWRPESIQFLGAKGLDGKEYPHAFVSYLSSGNRRALFVAHLDPRAADPDKPVPLFVELAPLGLSSAEAAAFRQAAKSPSLVTPASSSLDAAVDVKQETLAYYHLKMAPFQVAVVEFEVAAAPVAAAAGAEQPLFPAPGQTDRTAARVVWRDGGNLHPSGSDPLGAVAFVSPDDGNAGMGIYASLWNLNSEEMFAGIFRLPGIPPNEPVHLYDGGRIPPETRLEVERILRGKVLPKKGTQENGWEEKGLEVVARLSGTPRGKDWIVPMLPIDAGGGQIRFEGWMPARPEYVGDYTVTVEVRWGTGWHRLKETGRFRIHPLSSNGHKLRVPEAKKHKLWVSPTGQPVVIGWDPRWNLRKTAPSWEVPVADQKYWIQFWDGRFYLLNREQMERFGFSYDPDRPGLWPDQPIVEAAINVDPSGGIVIIPSGEVFDDKGKTLGARLEKAFEVLGVRWPLEGFQPLSQPQADEQYLSLQTLFERLNQIGDPGSLRDFLAPWGERGWERMGAILHRTLYEERDRFLHLLHQQFAQWAEGEKKEEDSSSAPVFRVSNKPLPRAFHPSGSPLVALTLNGVLDLIWRERKDLKGRPIEQTLLPGGGPLSVARAAANLREGGEVDILALGSGESGERLFAGLRKAGFREESQDGQAALLIPVKGEETRISVNGVVSSSPTVPADTIRQAVDAAVRRMAAYGPRKGTLVIGEHLVRMSDSEDPYWVAKALADLAKAAKEMGWKVAVAASSSWDAKTFDEILEARPDLFHLDLEPFARLVSSQQKKYTEEDLLYLPKQDLAHLADQLRGLYGVERLLVSLGAAGEILITPSGWFSAVPSPDLELTYVTGERDLVLGVFTRLLQMGASEKEALHQAVVGGVLHMEGWGHPVTQKEIEVNSHRAQVYELLQPARSRAAFVGPAETPSFPEASMATRNTEPKKVVLRKVMVTNDLADQFARAARESPVRVVMGPSAFREVEGLARAVELLAGTSLGERLVVLPKWDMSFMKFNFEMNGLMEKLLKVKDLSLVGYADEEDRSWKNFEARMVSKKIQPQRHRPQELLWVVRQILLDLGVPEGVATEKAVERFLSAAGMEQNV